MNKELGDIMMSFLEDKSSALKEIMFDMQSNAKHISGLDKFLSNIDKAELEEADIRQKFKTLMKVSKKQSDITSRLLIIIFVYMQSSSFDTDVSRLLVKLGRGDEAIKQMFKNKMGS
mgnify:CR=1 FL=1